MRKSELRNYLDKSLHLAEEVKKKEKELIERVKLIEKKLKERGLDEDTGKALDFLKQDSPLFERETGYTGERNKTREYLKILGNVIEGEQYKIGRRWINGGERGDGVEKDVFKKPRKRLNK